MQQAVDLARMQNPNLLSANAHVDATKQSEITAGLRVNPNFSFNGQDVPTIAALTALLTPILLLILVFLAYAVVSFRQEGSAIQDGPPMI